MNVRSDQNASQLESEAAATRARLSNHLDGLVNGLTPGHIIDEVIAYSRRGGGDFLRGLTHAAAANPVPTLLIGAGCAMFLSGRGRLTGQGAKKAESHAAAQTEWQRSMRGAGVNRAEQGSTLGGLKAGASSVGSAVSSTIGEGAAAVQSAAASVASHLREGAAGAASQVAEGVKAAGDTVSDYTGALREKVGEQSGRARQQATLFGRELNAKTAALFEEQPLLLAAGGLAIGALIAAMLPRTRLEDTYLGETSDAVKQAVGHAASEQYRETKEAAGQVVERIKDTAAGEDLAGTARAAVRDIGDKLKTVAEAASDTLDQEAGKIVRQTIGRPSGNNSNNL